MSRSLDFRFVTGRSPMKMSPRSMSSRPASMRRLVDLPQPDGPTSTRNSPSETVRERLSTAGLSALGKTRVACSYRTLATVASFAYAGRRLTDFDRALDKLIPLAQCSRSVRALSHYQAQALRVRARNPHTPPHTRERRRESTVRTSTSWRHRKTAAAILLTAAVALVATLATTASATSHDSTTLRVDLFGDFGYHDLYKQFEKTHPGVTIKEDIEDYATHHSNLAKHLGTRAGADDIEAIEVGFISQFKSEPQYFVDLNQFGAAKLK